MIVELVEVVEVHRLSKGENQNYFISSLYKLVDLKPLYFLTAASYISIYYFIYFYWESASVSN